MLAEFAHKPLTEGVIVACGPAEASLPQPEGEQFTLYSAVERLHLSKPLEIAGGGVRVLNVQLAQSAQRLLGERVEPLTLHQRPLGIRLVCEEVTLVKR